MKIIIEKNKIPSFKIDKEVSALVKFLSCIIIVLHHYAQYAIISGKSSDICTFFLSSQCGYLAVSTFFFLSGYGLNISFSRNRLSFRTYISKRLAKVYLPAVVVTILWLIILDLLGVKSISLPQGDVCYPILLVGIIKAFCFCFYDSILWFVKVIVALYVVFFFYKQLNLKQIKYEILVLFLLTVLTILSVWATIGAFAAVSVPSFFLGILISGNSCIVDKKLPWFWSVILFILSLAVVGELYVFLHGLMSIFTLLFLIYVFSYFKIEKVCIPKIFGDLSYDIYLIHNKVKNLIIYYTDGLSFLSFVFCTTIIVLGYYYIKKIFHLNKFI